jgi:hypothetical protein
MASVVAAPPPLLKVIVTPETPILPEDVFTLPDIVKLSSPACVTVTY